VNAAQLLRLENPSPTLLKLSKSGQRRGESFVWSGQLEPPVLGDGLQILRSYQYKSIRLHHYKSMLPHYYKFLVLATPSRGAASAGLRPHVCGALLGQAVSSARQPVNSAYKLAGERATPIPWAVNNSCENRNNPRDFRCALSGGGAGLWVRFHGTLGAPFYIYL
jgi:hypothetical protein